MVASIELTHKCNLKYIHFYGKFSEKTALYMPLSKAKQLLLDLKNSGVRSIELTGGDISVYPYLKEIIIEALTLGYFQINLLTNGIELEKEFIDLIISNKDRIFIQLDLHSLDDNYLTWFTKKKIL